MYTRVLNVHHINWVAEGWPVTQTTVGVVSVCFELFCANTQVVTLRATLGCYRGSWHICHSKLSLTNSVLFPLSFYVQDAWKKSLFGEEDNDGDEDPQLEAVKDFGAEKLSGFQERIEAVEGLFLCSWYQHTV